jgi:hypothetical protein
MDPLYINHIYISINSIPNLIEINSVVSEMKGKCGRMVIGFQMRDHHTNIGKSTRKTVNVNSPLMASNLVMDYKSL